MAAIYEIVPATLDHVTELALTMRPADVAEVWASNRRRPSEALQGSMAGTRDPKTGLINGRVGCMFGVAEATFLSTDGVPWLLGSTELPRHAKAFLRMSRAYMQETRLSYPVLRNLVDSRNTQSIRWLRWLGFDILDAKPFGPDRILFHPFEMLRDDDNSHSAQLERPGQDIVGGG